MFIYISLQYFNGFEKFNENHKYLKYDIPESEILDIVDETCLNGKTWERYRSLLLKLKHCIYSVSLCIYGHLDVLHSFRHYYKCTKEGPVYWYFKISQSSFPDLNIDPKVTISILFLISHAAISLLCFKCDHQHLQVNAFYRGEIICEPDLNQSLELN